MKRIPLVIAAKNEAATITACVTAARRAAERAERDWPVQIEIRVVCDDCVDATEARAREAGVITIRSSGGKIAAQRLGADVAAPYYLFCDADVVMSDDALTALCTTMETQPNILAASVPRVPVRTARGLIADAAYVYNLRRGFRVEAAGRADWISGRLFAVRSYDVPQTRSPPSPDRFLALEAGLVAEDLYLSRSALQRGGPNAICETSTGAVYFRPPATLRGMYHYYRRLRRETERTDALFPALRPHHKERRVDRRSLRRAPPRERALFAVFTSTMRVFSLLYRIERAYHRRVLRRSGAVWPVVPESKQPISPTELPRV